MQRVKELKFVCGSKCYGCGGCGCEVHLSVCIPSQVYIVTSFPYFSLLQPPQTTTWQPKIKLQTRSTNHYPPKLHTNTRTLKRTEISRLHYENTKLSRPPCSFSSTVSFEPTTVKRERQRSCIRKKINKVGKDA